MKRTIEMSFDPAEFDEGQLGDAEFVFPDEGSERGRRTSHLGADRYRELLVLQSGLDDASLSKPYLDALPESYAAEVVVFEWLETLVDRGGFKRTYDALGYYEALDWVTGPVADDLRDHLAGVADPESAGTRAFDQDDHIESLVYIAKLASL